MLFSCKIAIKKEDHRANILPFYGNSVKSNLGKYLKDFLQKLPRNTFRSLLTPIDQVCYICMIGLLSQNDLDKHYPTTLPHSMGEILEYYKEYTHFYRLIK